MKKMFCKLLSILLVLCLCIGLTACGAQSAAGGLGTLTMDDGKSGGIGTLGEPGGADEPSEPGEPTVPAEPDAPAPQEPAPNDGYAVFSSTKQDFSFLYDEGYTAKWSDENGATVYTEHEDSIPYILVFCNHQGDTNGFDISNFFYFKIEEIKEQYGSRLKSVSEVLTLTVGDKKVPGVLFTYTVDTYTVEMFLLLDDTGDSLMQYTAKYVQGEGEPTMQALVRAMTTMKLDADYYANGSGTGTGTGTGTQTPQQTPAPAALSTESYECKYFTLTKPVGWEVFYEVIDAGGGAKRLYTFVYDPTNPNNMFFFAQVLEQFYVSESSKQAWLPYMPSYFSNAPVISGDPTAEATLAVWGDVFAVMRAEGSASSAYFRDYELTEVIESKVLNSPPTTGTTSYVLGMVTIPGAREQSLILFQNTLVLMNAPTGLPASAKYYSSHSNMGVVLSESAAGSQFNTVLSCLQSFDPSAFANRDSFKSGTTDGGIAVPETDISSLF